MFLPLELQFSLLDHLLLEAAEVGPLVPPEGENTIQHQKIFFLQQTSQDGFSLFCTKIS